MKCSCRFLAIWLLLSALVASCTDRPMPDCASKPEVKPADADLLAYLPELIVQLKDENGDWLKITKGETSFRVYSRLPADDPRSVAFRQVYAKTPEYRLLIELIEAAKRFLKNSEKVPAGIDPVQWHRMLEDPLYLAVEGILTNSPSQGLVIRTEKGDEEHQLTQYVGCASTLHEISKPGFINLILHETGHLLARFSASAWVIPVFDQVSRIESLDQLTPLLRLRSGQLHDIQQTTFGYGALEEGMAEAWETLLTIRKPVIEADAWKLDPAQSLRLVSRHTIRPKRPDLIRWNRLIFEQATPSPEVENKIGFDAAYMLYRRTMPLDNHRLKPCGPQMATEGVFASLFVRLITSRELQDAPLPPELVTKIAPPGSNPDAWLASLGPDGRGLLRLVLAILSIDQYHPDVTVLNVSFHRLVDTWLKMLPSDAATVIRTVVMTTMGATASIELSSKIRRFLAASENFPLNDSEPDHVQLLTDELTALADTIKDANVLFAACGPEIWVRLEGKKLCNEWGTCSPFEVDLNAAEEMDFRMFPGVSATKARELIELRDTKGWFSTPEEFFQAAGISEEQRTSILLLPKST